MKSEGGVFASAFPPLQPAPSTKHQPIIPIPHFYPLQFRLHLPPLELNTRTRPKMALDDWFIEIQQQKQENNLPEHIDCYILVNIDPKCCGNLARDLNAIFPLRDVGQSIDNTDDIPIKSEEVKLPATSHLKRIRRRAATVDELELIAHNTTRCQNDALANGGNDPNENGHVCVSGSPQEETPKKRAKKNGTLRTWSLDILVGSIAAVDNLLNVTATSYETYTTSNTSTLESILSKYDMSKTNLVRQSLPGRPAETKEELQQWNANLWPTLFFEKKTDQFKEEELQLSIEETNTMLEGMRAAVQDAIVGRRKWQEYKTAILCRDDRTISFPGCDISGVVVMNPQSSSIVSRASDERVLQSGNNAFPDEQNPLCTSTILAIQGVSRAERQNALGHGMESKEFKRGQVSKVDDIYV